jgi:hypothetical protein
VPRRLCRAGGQKQAAGLRPADFFAQIGASVEAASISAGRTEPFARFERLIGRKTSAWLQGRSMADRAALGFLGFILGGVTAAVVLVALTVVVGHVEGRLALDTGPTQVAANQY